MAILLAKVHIQTVLRGGADSREIECLSLMLKGLSLSQLTWDKKHLLQ